MVCKKAEKAEKTGYGQFMCFEFLTMVPFDLDGVVKAVLMALLPLLCCLVRTAAEGRSIGQVYLPSSEWNDELFYFKQVEGIVNYGFPRGYFGFNESHALQLSFAAWSPVLVFPWILWGLLFGWNLLMPW